MLNDFSGLFQELYKSKPDLVVLQQEMLTKARVLRARWFFSRRYIESKYFSPLTGEAVFDQEKHQVSMECSVLKKGETAEGRRDYFLKWAYFTSIPERPKVAVDFLEHLDNLKVPILAVSVPVAPKGASVYPVPPKEPILQVVAPEYSFNDSQYCDVVHMNSEGREIYSSWLMEVLRDKLEIGV
ncbi:hypothetical protein [Microbulbifer sp. JMSA003]|uniref:hypothetical protein n=1 Tax=Microbulbifer sp. JMSA003 TaxID=3243369 RepID=UPI00403A1C83